MPVAIGWAQVGSLRQTVMGVAKGVDRRGRLNRGGARATEPAATSTQACGFTPSRGVAWCWVAAGMTLGGKRSLARCFHLGERT